MIIGKKQEGFFLKFIMAIILLTCLLGCTATSTPESKMDTVTATPKPVQGFMGHVYAYYGGPAVLCDSDICPTNVPMRSPMGGIRLVAVKPETLEIIEETTSLEDGSYEVNVPPGMYQICIKWETGMTCSRTITIPENTYIVEDFDVGQG
jgi:hypothetical protein